MPIGFQTFVDGTEIIQIDSERFTYVLKTTGTVTGSPQYGFYGGSYNIASVTIPSCVRPIVFCPPGQVISSEFFSSGTLQFSILSTITSTLEYAVFDIGNYPTTPNIGLKLYNSLGQITFDSNLSPLFVFSSGYEEPQNINTTSIPTLDITRSYWYTGGGSYTTVYSSSEGFGELISEDYLNIFFTNGTTGGFSQEFLSSGGHNQEPSVEYGPGSNFIIADMTHIVGVPTGIIIGHLSQTLGTTAASATSSVNNNRTGNLSQTLGTTAVSATSSVSRTGNLSQTLGTTAVSATSSVSQTGNLSQTLGTTAVSATSSVSKTGNLSQTLGTTAVSATSSVNNNRTGNLSQTLGETTVSATGINGNNVVGNLSQTLGTTAVSATSSVNNNRTGNLSQTLGTTTVSATGTIQSFTPVTRIYTSGSGTETVPANATTCVITCDGAGGSGRYTTGFLAGGGGSGARVIKTITVSGGQTMSYSVGVGGAARTTATNGLPGGTSTVNSWSGGTLNLSAGGGSGGTLTGGAGGVADGGDVGSSNGDPGADGQYDAEIFWFTDPSGGGVNGGIFAGDGGGNANDAGPGGGGSGNRNAPSGAGGNGRIKFYYT